MLKLAKNLYVYTSYKGERQYYQSRCRYSGDEIRRLNAERGCGSSKRIDPGVRALFVPTKR